MVSFQVLCLGLELEWGIGLAIIVYYISIRLELSSNSYLYRVNAFRLTLLIKLKGPINQIYCVTNKTL